MEIVFGGDEAKDHRIEAYTGAASLEGIARAATLAAHFAATGKVRFRAPYSNEIEFHISVPVEGSLKFPLEAISQVTGALAEHKAKVAGALLLVMVARATGQVDNSDLEIEGVTIPSGTLDALAEAATPGLERAHRWIDSSDKAISIGGLGVKTIELDETTKEYLESEHPGEQTSQDVTVAALNANSKTGRVFFSDLGRTVPFKIAKEAKARTTANLSRYLTRYVNKTNEWVVIEFQPFYYSDGRLKRIIIFDCELASDQE